MISLQDLLEEIDFKPKNIFLEDGDRTIKIDRDFLGDEPYRSLNCFFELVPVEGRVYFVEHAWQNEIDLHFDTSLLELLRDIDEEQNGMYDQKPAKYLLMIKHALEDLHFGDEDGIMELVSLIEAREEI